MQRIEYIGPHEAVDLALPNGGWVQVDRGGTVEVDDEHAASLLEQKTNWQRAAGKTKAGASDVADAATAAAPEGA